MVVSGFSNIHSSTTERMPSKTSPCLPENTEMHPTIRNLYDYSAHHVSLHLQSPYKALLPNKSCLKPNHIILLTQNYPLSVKTPWDQLAQVFGFSCQQKYFCEVWKASHQHKKCSDIGDPSSCNSKLCDKFLSCASTNH